jgi:hypothetical protein
VLRVRYRGAAGRGVPRSGVGGVPSQLGVDLRVTGAPGRGEPALPGSAARSSPIPAAASSALPAGTHRGSPASVITWLVTECRVCSTESEASWPMAPASIRTKAGSDSSASRSMSTTVLQHTARASESDSRPIASVSVLIDRGSKRTIA